MVADEVESVHDEVSSETEGLWKRRPAEDGGLEKVKKERKKERKHNKRKRERRKENKINFFMDQIAPALMANQRKFHWSVSLDSHFKLDSHFEPLFEIKFILNVF